MSKKNRKIIDHLSKSSANSLPFGDSMLERLRNGLFRLRWYYEFRCRSPFQAEDPSNWECVNRCQFNNLSQFLSYCDLSLPVDQVTQLLVDIPFRNCSIKYVRFGGLISVHAIELTSNYKIK